MEIKLKVAPSTDKLISCILSNQNQNQNSYINCDTGRSNNLKSIKTNRPIYISTNYNFFTNSHIIYTKLYDILVNIDKNVNEDRHKERQMIDDHYKKRLNLTSSVMNPFDISMCNPHESDSQIYDSMYLNLKTKRENKVSSFISTQKPPYISSFKFFTSNIDIYSRCVSYLIDRYYPSSLKFCIINSDLCTSSYLCLDTWKEVKQPLKYFGTFIKHSSNTKYLSEDEEENNKIKITSSNKNLYSSFAILWYEIYNPSSFPLFLRLNIWSIMNTNKYLNLDTWSMTKNLRQKDNIYSDSEFRFYCTNKKTYNIYLNYINLYIGIIKNTENIKSNTISNTSSIAESSTITRILITDHSIVSDVDITMRNYNKEKLIHILTEIVKHLKST